MSAPINTTPASELVNIEINGQALQVVKGSMIIQAADAAGIAIPRFCYHHKLPVAANCRMCMVEVEKMPKPAPACATPVMEGMKIFTHSQRALKSQRNVMEFILINHPLDCPICDQGGECELQDLALGYGRSVSRFIERKRVLADEDIGPLIATDMTRCILCTRCVRFVSEIAGSYELGGMGRGEHLEIGTYIGKNLESELSGNIIDVCPVGALTNKVFRFRARAWELIAKPSIAYHDALGSNLWVHSRHGEALRVVPRDNEAINECWLSDRDRYSHQGLGAADRLTRPLVKHDGSWQETDWEHALEFTVARLGHFSGPDVGALIQPGVSCEEGQLLSRLMQGLGSPHIDHRLDVLDFADAPVVQPFELAVPELQKVQAALLVGSDLRHEIPLVNHRLHQAVKGGAHVYALNPAHFDTNLKFTSEIVVAPQQLVDRLAALVRVASERDQAPQVGSELRDRVAATAPHAGDREWVEALAGAEHAVVLLGHVAAQHPQASWLRALLRYLATATGADFNELPLGANDLGLARAGVLPGREGLNARSMLTTPRQAYLLYNAEFEDFADSGAALKALSSAELVVAFSAFSSERLREVADVLLPIGLLPEVDATLVNLDGMVQQVASAARLPGEARPGWRVLRALGEQLKLAGFDFTQLEELRGDLHPMLGQSVATGQGLARFAWPTAGLVRLATRPIYRSDPVLRRCEALARHPLSRPAEVVMHADDLVAQGLQDGASARVDGVTLPVRADACVPAGTAWIESHHPETLTLPEYGQVVTISKV